MAVSTRRYDTDEIRAVARKIKRVAGDVSDVSSSQVRRMVNELPDGFVGEAADALNSQLNSLRSDLNSTSNGLNNIANALIRYAEQLEEIDRQMAEAIREH